MFHASEVVVAPSPQRSQMLRRVREDGDPEHEDQQRKRAAVETAQQEQWDGEPLGHVDATRDDEGERRERIAQQRKRRISALRTHGGAGAYPYDDGRYGVDNNNNDASSWLPTASSVMDVDFEATGVATPSTPDLPPQPKRLNNAGGGFDDDDEGLIQWPTEGAGGEEHDEEEMSWEGPGRFARVENPEDSRLLQEHDYAAPNFLLRTLTLDRLGRQRQRPSE
jgi:hypothetical protein